MCVVCVCVCVCVCATQTKANTSTIEATKEKMTFKDVAGCDEAKVRGVCV